MIPARRFAIAVGAVAVVGLVLRLKGLHDPIFDHPGWRQGDTAAIARNFATLQLDPLFPQTDYDGPPPNYVELELQIVPFLAALLYKLFGVHEVFGRLLSIGFGVATIPLLALFGRWLFTSALAGIAAAAAYAIFPGAWYYSHTFMPDTAMVFFTTAALYAGARWIADGGAGWRGWWAAALLLALAFLAKPVAVTAAIPLAAAGLARLGWRDALRRPQLWALFAAAFVPLALYDRIVSAHAEWHWASGITTLHVLPGLRAALTSPHAFAAKALAFGHALRMLATTMLGPVGFGLAAVALAVPPRSRSDALLWGWLGGGLLYAYVVVTVERVDYYLYLLLPLGALLIGRLCAFAAERLAGEPQRRTTLAALGGLVWLIALYAGYRQIAPYYRWSRVELRARQAARRCARARSADRDGPLRPLDPLHDRPQGLGGGPAPVDAVRRAERDPQGRALLRLGRAPAAEADEPGAVLLAGALPAARPGSGLAGLRHRPRQGTARRRGPLEGLSQARDGRRVRRLAPRPMEDGGRPVPVSTTGEIARDGVPAIPERAIRTRPDGQVVVDVFPLERADRLLLDGVRAEVWMEPGVTRASVRDQTAAALREPDPPGSLTLVLGAGNIAAIPPLDVLAALYAHDSVAQAAAARCARRARSPRRGPKTATMTAAASSGRNAVTGLRVASQSAPATRVMANENV